MAGRNVAFVKPAEASFITRIKQKVGFKEGPTIDTKREQLPKDDSAGNDRDDERPQVVVMEHGDLTQEEADSILDSLTANETALLEEKVSYKKPTKRENVASDLMVSSSTSVKKAKKDHKSEMKQVKNRRLLSFDDEEHDDN